MKPLPILFKDQVMVAVHKSSGLLVHRTSLSRNRKCVLQTLRDQIGQRVYPVHRLDRPASGVLLFALDPAACRALSSQFAGQSMTKRYLAVVRGVTPTQGTIDYPLRREPDKTPQSAVTSYHTLASVELPVAVGPYATSRYSLVAVFPKTGRRHQIRKHFAHISHPLIGDTAHGEGRHNRLFANVSGCTGSCSPRLNSLFVTPVTQAPVAICAPPAEEFGRFINAVGWKRAARDTPWAAGTPSAETMAGRGMGPPPGTMSPLGNDR